MVQNFLVVFCHLRRHFVFAFICPLIFLDPLLESDNSLTQSFDGCYEDLFTYSQAAYKLTCFDFRIICLIQIDLYGLDQRIRLLKMTRSSMSEYVYEIVQSKTFIGYCFVKSYCFRFLNFCWNQIKALLVMTFC